MPFPIALISSYPCPIMILSVLYYKLVYYIALSFPYLLLLKSTLVLESLINSKLEGLVWWTGLSSHLNDWFLH